MSRRVIANLVIFAILGLVLAGWAATNVLSIDAITHPYGVTAEFASSPGLHSNFEVAYLGVKVGQIAGVRLQPGQAVVALRIDRGVKLPVGLTAAASRQSAIGEPYVALSPPAGYVDGGPYIKPGYVIGVADTTVPLSYEDVFAALDRLAAAVPPQDLDTLLHELALSLNGRADTIRQLLENSDALTTTLAANAGQVDQLIGDLTELTHTLAANRGAIGTSLDNLAAVTATLAQSRADIASLLATAPGFAAQVNAILATSEGSLGCLLDGLGGVATVLSSPAQVQALEHLLTMAPSLLPLIPEIETQTATGPMLRGSAHINAGGPPVPVYATPRTLPPVPKVPVCPATSVPAAGSPSVAAGSASPSVAGFGPNTVPTVEPGRTVTAARPSSTKVIPGHSYPVALLVILVVLLLVLTVTRPWRLVRRRPPS
jgi:phospholipid/cholesterol/gamma-HCH transport system substrate-binding protein